MFHHSKYGFMYAVFLRPQSSFMSASEIHVVGDNFCKEGFHYSQVKRKILIDPGTRFRERDDLTLSQSRPYRKSHHFVCVRASSMREFLRSKDAQCN